MPEREYGALLRAYTVAFAEQLLRRAAPLSASSEDDARLVRFLCTHFAFAKSSIQTMPYWLASQYCVTVTYNHTHTLESKQECLVAVTCRFSANKRRSWCSRSANCAWRCCWRFATITYPRSILNSHHVPFQQVQLVFEVSQLRSGLLLAVPDQWGALRARCLPPTGGAYRRWTSATRRQRSGCRGSCRSPGTATPSATPTRPGRGCAVPHKTGDMQILDWKASMRCVVDPCPAAAASRTCVCHARWGIAAAPVVSSAEASHTLNAER